ncbi:Hypothetical protein A7982_01421 [Minicystis rosea]|nr:Hypothetical protein A7982_01421 [Minicystis rosea]
MIAATLSASSTLGCAAIKPPLTSPSQGGYAWTEATSRHFVVRTDLDPEDAQHAIRQFETVYNVFTDVAFPTDESRAGRIDVVVFRRESDYRALGRRGSDAYFSPSLANDLEPVPTAVMFGQLENRARLTFQHELTHHFIRQSLSSAPVWLNEGMAEYYSTIHVADGRVFLGGPLPNIGITRAPKWLFRQNGTFTRAFVPASHLPSVERLVGADRATFYAAHGSSATAPSMDQQREQTTFYVSAWALVHLLMTGPEDYRKRFSAFIDALTHGARAMDAWEQAFAGVDTAELSRALYEHVLRATLPIMSRAYTLRPPEPLQSERAMSDAEVHLLWARLDKWGEGGGSRALEHLDAALAGDPSSPEVHYWRALFFVRQSRFEDAQPEIAAALAAKPEEPRYLLAALKLALARGSRATPEAQALVQRLAQVARTATELDAVARAEARLRHADAGLPFAERAVKADPTCYRCMDTYAVLLFEKGRLRDAVAAEERAIELLPEEHDDTELVRRLRSFRSAEKQKPAPAPP